MAYDATAIAQFENINELRQYPFAEQCSLLDATGRELPRNLVVDAHFVVPSNAELVLPDETAPVVRLTSAHVSEAMVSVCFCTEWLGSVQALSVIVSRESFVPYVPYRLEKLVGSRDIGGCVEFGDMSFPHTPETYRFSTPETMRNAEIHHSCVAVAKPAGLRRIIDRRSGMSVAGDVSIAFSGYVNASKSGDEIKLELAKDADTELMASCIGLQASVGCGATPIRTINGISPDADGNIVLWFH